MRGEGDDFHALDGGVGDEIGEAICKGRLIQCGGGIGCRNESDIGDDREGDGE